MIEIKPTGVQINMSIEDAKTLSLYLTNYHYILRLGQSRQALTDRFQTAVV